jgi:peptidoglycan/LPS O-acetylase OafA/YrhL
MGASTDLAGFVASTEAPATVVRPSPRRASPGDGGSAAAGVRATIGRRVVELDGVRGLAALAVMGGHWLAVVPHRAAGPVNGPLTSGLNWLLGTPLQAFVAGGQMVILFFVLSGMVLALPRLAGRQIPYGRYLLTRALRLYPAAWAATALSALVFLVLRPHTEPGFTTWLRVQLDAPIPSAGVFHFTGLIIPFDPSRLDGPLWSLEQELRLSLLLPLLVLLVRRYHSLVVFFIAVVLIVEGTASSTVLASWAWTPVVGGCFLLGVLLARHRERLNHLWAGMSKPARRLAGLGMVLSFWIPTRFASYVFVDRLALNLIPALGACAVIVAAQGPGLRQRLRTRVPAWLGRISYSLYVVHIVVLHLLLGVRPAGLPVIDLAPAGIVLSLGLATLMQRYVEAPALALGRRTLGGFRKPARPAIPAAPC